MLGFELKNADPIFEPQEPYEKEGIVNNVVFPCGMIVREGLLYIYYGGPTAGTKTNQRKSAAWNSNYIGVWHLPNGTTLTALDSTSNANNGTINGTVAVVGKIDGAGNFDGSNDYINVGDVEAVDTATTPNVLYLRADGVCCR